jgi:hypothetical protein
MRLSLRTMAVAFGILAFVLAVSTAVAAFDDWGLDQQTQLQNKSHPLFGVGQPLTESSKVDPLTSTPGQQLRPLAATAKLTGYYRPEDISLDDAAIAAGNVRLCGNNTSRDTARYWGETICITDGTVAGAISARAGIAAAQHARQHRLPSKPRQLDH